MSVAVLPPSLVDPPSPSAAANLKKGRSPLQTFKNKHRFGTRHVLQEGSGFQNVRFGYNPRLYDSGTPYRIAYSRNSDPDAIENFLCGEDESARKAAAESVFVKVFGNEWYNEGKGIVSGATYTIRTEQGRPTITVRMSSPRPPIVIDRSLEGLRRVPLSELVRISSLAGTVDSVYHEGGMYACKLVCRDIHHDDPLKEVKTAVELKQSPYIIDVLALVACGDQYRGFLMRYSTVGSLADALQLRKYGWNVRAQFAYDIVLGVQALHSIGAFNGDLKPENVILMWTAELVDRPRAQLIDLEAHGGRTSGFTDPDLAHEDRPSAHQDIYSIGRILRWLANNGEAGNGIPAYIPKWYTHVMERCEGTLDLRPTIHDIVNLFDLNL